MLLECGEPGPPFVCVCVCGIFWAEVSIEHFGKVHA